MIKNRTSFDNLCRSANVVLLGYSIFKTIQYGLAYYQQYQNVLESATYEEKKMGFKVGDDLNDSN